MLNNRYISSFIKSIADYSLILFTILFLFIVLSVNGQNSQKDSHSVHGQSSLNDTNSVNEQNSENDTVRKKEIENKYRHYVVKYPARAREYEIEGTVTISYDIDSTCSIINRKVVSGIGYGCDEASLKVLDNVQKDMKLDNKSNCKPLKDVIFPVVFKLQ